MRPKTPSLFMAGLRALLLLPPSLAVPTKLLNGLSNPLSADLVVRQITESQVSAFPDIDVNVPQTQTRIILKEEINPEAPIWMPKAGFHQAMNEFISAMELSAIIFGDYSEAPWNAHEERVGRYVVSIETGQDGRKPTWGDLRAAGTVIRDNIEHFSISSRNYKDVQTHVIRMGQDPSFPLAVMDVFVGRNGYHDFTNATVQEIRVGRDSIAETQTS